MTSSSCPLSWKVTGQGFPLPTTASVTKIEILSLVALHLTSTACLFVFMFVLVLLFKFKLIYMLDYLLSFTVVDLFNLFQALWG